MTEAAKPTFTVPIAATPGAKAEPVTMTIPPSVVHFLEDGLTYSQQAGYGVVSSYGDVLQVTPEIIAANTDRLGNCWLIDLVDDPAGQSRRWGEVYFARGPWPRNLPLLRHGSLQWELAREAARKEAFKIEDVGERADALDRVTRQYGPPTKTSSTLSTYTGAQG